ncbi:AAA family ATPase [Bacteroides sp. 519]|uniref:AAA family ATPase n=1 Tax=Bacteroides sp. 519 TaxID=2302937 RepID=UPI0013D89528|nr:AAA family ATPase [Bacteroides sp. 519]NDV60756.1 ATP-dependent exonuclease [Bacteroides sp. 519]
MKILAIRGKNLASLEGDFEIDFTTEPLKSTGLFAITGPTGAGKSTILDALCVALFDDAPRLNKAEASINVADVEDKTITQRDSRNILRRGTSEGYAEVDFVALNGDKYRSRWMVRRARGRIDGALQATSLKLENLTTNCEEQGTKKDLLNRITEIIGLTFDQFTRAVLLAQGDFATFLKAKQNEKAELLEKLTGTEVYSRISALIYQKTNDARIDLELLNHRIADIKLLTYEELEHYNQEKNKLKAGIEPLKQQQTVISKKLEWLNETERIKAEIRQAELQLNDIRTKIREASPRYDYLTMLDTSQEIRDTYIDLINKRKHHQNLLAFLQKQEEELQKVTEKLVLANEQFKTIDTQLKEAEQRYNNLKPEINKAREIDRQMHSLKERLQDMHKELSKIKTQHDNQNKNIATIQKQLEDSKKIKTDLHNWFETNDKFKEIVSRYDLIINLLNDARIAGEQKKNVLVSLDSSKKLLQTYTVQQKQYEEEAGRLNTLLPTEVLILRRKLEEGQPCPVCGSIEHPLLINHTDAENSAINEEELEKAKAQLVKEISQTTKNIEDTLKNITVFETHIHSYQTQYTNTITNLTAYLQKIDQWELKLEQGVLQKELSQMVKTWNDNQLRLTKCEQFIENTTLKLSLEQKSFDSLQEDFRTRTELYNEQTKVWKDYVEQRSAILGGKTVDEAEDYFAKLREKLTRQYNSLRDEREKTDKEKATINGVIGQFKKDIQDTIVQTGLLEQTVSQWLDKKTHSITPEILKDLITKSAEWVNQERKYLTGIKEQELILSTTMQEKNNRFNRHLELPDKPTDETKEQLVLLVTETASQQDEMNKRLTEIEVLLATHNNGKERIKAIESELKTKNELYTNWAKLNELLGSAKGDKFKTIAQGYTLDVLLSYANKHLEELTGRYKLEKIPNTLALQVVDNDMLGEIRTVHSLSGGESFLISLSLALGLSALSSNRMKIESLFIDEGFGALDIDTLNVAMDALDNLQTQGRKIGVISHVEEMKERVNVQIQVTKASNGRSSVRVVG